MAHATLLLSQGGLKKEWFVLLVRELFDPAYGMFLYDEDSQLCFFNPGTLILQDAFFLRS